MLTALLISYVMKATQTLVPPDSVHNQTHDGIDNDHSTDDDDIDGDDDADEDTFGKGECEDVALKILLDRGGALREANQVVDYLYRGETLRSMALYDFCRCVRLEKI